ncbi:hypothetical protein FI667_g9324, partial [Globisporangium splendens]
MRVDTFVGHFDTQRSARRQRLGRVVSAIDTRRGDSIELPLENRCHPRQTVVIPDQRSTFSSALELELVAKLAELEGLLIQVFAHALLLQLGCRFSVGIDALCVSNSCSKTELREYGALRINAPCVPVDWVKEQFAVHRGAVLEPVASRAHRAATVAASRMADLTVLLLTCAAPVNPQRFHNKRLERIQSPPSMRVASCTTEGYFRSSLCHSVTNVPQRMVQRTLV